jgi:hypothetical protein
VLALALADVLVRDGHPVVPVRVGDHLLDQAAIRLLDVSPAGDLGLGLADPHDQRVTDALEVGGAQHARPARGADAPADPAARESRDPELAELPLEPGDLASKLVANTALLLGGRSGAELELVLCE